MKKISETKIIIPKIKRLFDIFFSFLLFILTLPLFVIILAAIFIEHILRGDFLAPLFYCEKRISQGKKFNLIKFNIFNPSVIKEMRKKGEFIATKELEKKKTKLITVGYALKQTYLDELPQLLNILNGDISFVGPRPVNLKVYENLLKRGVNNKTIIKAGLTGNYQSQKGLTKKTDVELDREYINFCLNNPVWRIMIFDLKILARTLGVLLRAKGI